MARASINFEDSGDQMLVSLNFDDQLPDDPADATEAQIAAMVLFREFMSQYGADMQESPNGEPDFDDGEKFMSDETFDGLEDAEV